jgi:hypothetical protein
LVDASGAVKRPENQGPKGSTGGYLADCKGLSPVEASSALGRTLVSPCAVAPDNDTGHTGMQTHTLRLEDIESSPLGG